MRLFTKPWFIAALCAAFLGMGIQSAHAAAIVSGFDSSTLPGNDDGSTGLVNIGFNVNFFGNTFSQLYVNNNGNVTFDAALSTYTPFSITSTSREIIAPFFADVDTRSSDPVTYGGGLFNGRDTFGVNWIAVEHYNQLGPTNSFQLLLVDRSDIGAGDFDIIFNYDQILWEAGTASGSNAAGLGGDTARVGYSNGTGNPGTFFELPGSAVDGAFLDSNLATGLIHNSINSDVLGRYIFSARNGQILPPDGNGSVIPEPASMLLLGMGMGGLGFARRRFKA